jgi:uncharacterized damage-inducible protein DinB
MTGEPGADHNVPGIVSGEKETLLAFIGYLRASVDRKLEHLSDTDARRPLVASGTSLLGLVKHLINVEVYWSQRRFTGDEDVALRGDGFELDPSDTVESLRRRYAEAARRTDEIVVACPDLDHPLALGRHGLTLRWMLAHLLEETARHAGHADILRELVDGKTGR